MNTMLLPDLARPRSLAAALIAAVLAAGCANGGGMGQMMQTDTAKGALIGGSTGAVLGAIIDHSDPWAGALIGLAGGALAGGLVGHYMDQRKQNLSQALQPEINAGDANVQLLAGNSLQIDMTGKSAFAPGSAVLNANFMSTLQKISSVVKTYGKMTVSIIGYADATGTTAERAALASQRAEAVRLQMIGMGVPAGLISASGTVVNNYNDGRAVISLHPLVKS